MFIVSGALALAAAASIAPSTPPSLTYREARQWSRWGADLVAEPFTEAKARVWVHDCRRHSVFVIRCQVRLRGDRIDVGLVSSVRRYTRPHPIALGGVYFRWPDQPSTL